MELSKRDKKTAREIIETGLQREFLKVLSETDAILNKWKNKAVNNRDTYHRLYSHIIDFDKYLARRYDGVSGSNYLLFIIGQLRDGIISESDLENFSEGVRLTLKEFID